MSIRTTGVRYDVIAKDSASGVFKTVGDRAGRLDSGLGKLVKTAAYAGAALAGGLAVGLAVSADRAVKFEASMKKIQTQAGASAKDVKVLSAQVLELGKSTQQGPEKLSEALYHLKSVGMDNVDAMKALKTSSDLAAVGGADLEATTNALAGAWRTGIKGATDFTQSAKTVNAIIGAGNMTMEDMVAALGTGILPTAKTFGLTFAQVGGALALFTDEGVDSASAATRLRMSISLLAAPSKASEKQLKSIGLTGNKLGEAMRSKDGIIGAIKLLKEHLDNSGLSATKQAALLSRAFGGGKSSSAILSMVNNLDVLEKKQVQVNASMGKYGPAVEAQRKTAAAQFALIKSNFEVMAIKTGNVLLPPLTRFVTYINTKVLPVLGSVAGFIRTRMLPPVLSFGKTMTDKLIPVTDIKAKIGTLTADFSDFMKGLFPQREPVLGVQAKIRLPKSMPQDLLSYGMRAPTITPKVTLPKSMPQSLLNYGISPRVVAAPPTSAAQKMGKQVRGMISGGIDNALKGIDWSKLGSKLGHGLGTAMDWVVAHGGDLSKKVANAFAGIDFVSVGKSFGKTALPTAIGFIDSMFDPLFTVDFWKKHWLDTIIAVISIVPIGKVGGVIGKLFSKIPWGGLGKILDHVPWGKLFGWTRHISDTLGPALKGTGHFLSMLGKGFTEGFSHLFPRIGTFFYEQMLLLPVRLGDVGRLLVSKGKTMLTNFGDKLKKEIPLLGNKLVQRLLKIWGRFTLWQTGVHLVEGLLSGIGNGMVGIGKWIKGHIVDPVVNWVTGLFGVHSPSTVFAGIGGHLVEGLLSGIWSRMQGIGKWLSSHVINPVLSRFSNAGGWLVSRGSALVSGLKGGVWSVAKTVGIWVKKNVISPITSPFTDAWKWLGSPGKSFITGMKNGIVDGLKDIGGWLKTNLIDPIVSSVKHWFGIKSPSRVFASIGSHLVSGLMKGLAKTNGLDVAKTVFGDLPSALAGIVGKGLVSVQALPGKALAMLGGLGGQAKKLLGNVFGGGGGGSLVGQWATDVRAVLGMLGAPPDALGPVLKRIGIESGGDPNAINLTDVNAKAGHPSQGLMQTIPSTFNTYAGQFAGRGITDPLANIYAGVNYAMHRYGGDWIKVMTRPGGYAAGGLAPIGQTAWVGEKGAELMQVTAKGARIYNHRDSLALAKGAGITLPGYAKGTVSVGAAKHGVAAAERQVTALERQIAGLRRDEATAHSKSRRKRDQLAVMAAEERLKAARTHVTAAKKALSTAQAQAKQAQSVANTIANGFIKTLQTGTAAGIASAVKSMNTKLQAAGAGNLVAGNLRTSARLQSLANQKAGVVSRIATANQYASDQASGLGDFLSLGNIPSSSITSLVSRMQAKQKTASSFASEVAGLSKRGLDKGLLSQLADAGPGSQLATLLSKASAGDIAQLNKVAASQAKLTVSFGRTMADAMYDSGSQAGKGFLTGLQAQEKALQAEMNRLAAGMVSTIKHKLGIHSPSTVARDQIGKQFALGTALGVRVHAPRAHAEAQRMADTMAAVRARSGLAMAGASAGGGGGQTTHYEHHDHYEINARTADFTVQDLETTQRRVEARHRVGRPR